MCTAGDIWLEFPVPFLSSWKPIFLRLQDNVSDIRLSSTCIRVTIGEDTTLLWSLYKRLTSLWRRKTLLWRKCCVTKYSSNGAACRWRRGRWRIVTSRDYHIGESAGGTDTDGWRCGGEGMGDSYTCVCFLDVSILLLVSYGCLWYSFLNKKRW